VYLYHTSRESFLDSRSGFLDSHVVKLLAETCFLYDWWRKYHPKSPKPINATPEPSYINIPIGGRCDAHAVCGGVLTVG
jgi:hypothetical protein